MDYKYKVGDIVDLNGTPMYFAGVWGKQKTGNDPWEEQVLLCPVNKKLMPDKRILNSRAFKFRYRTNISKIKPYGL